MSKLTGTVAFIGGVLLILMAIAGVLIKNETHMAHSQPAAVVEESVEGEHGGGHEVPEWLKIAMYGTLLVSGGFTVAQVAKHGLSHQQSGMGTAAFIGGNVLVTLGFLATLAVNESKFRERDDIEAAIAISAPPVEDAHDSGIPETLHYWMMGTLFVAGGVTVVHVSKYGLA